MTICYRCDTCKRTHTLKTWVFNCIECRNEICEDCMFGWATCKTCAVGKTREFLEKRFDENFE